jgi:hypothetical protein
MFKLSSLYITVRLFAPVNDVKPVSTFNTMLKLLSVMDGPISKDILLSF